MKLAFSTLGCPDWPLESVLEAASKWQLDGVGVGGVLDESGLPNSGVFGPNVRGQTSDLLPELRDCAPGHGATVLLATHDELMAPADFNDVVRQAMPCALTALEG